MRKLTIRCQPYFSEIGREREKGVGGNVCSYCSKKSEICHFPKNGLFGDMHTVGKKSEIWQLGKKVGDVQLPWSFLGCSHKSCLIGEINNRSHGYIKQSCNPLPFPLHLWGHCKSNLVPNDKLPKKNHRDWTGGKSKSIRKRNRNAQTILYNLLLHIEGVLFGTQDCDKHQVSSPKYAERNIIKAWTSWSLIESF